jgi:MYXO-CTERM domain-containing protein
MCKVVDEGGTKVPKCVKDPCADQTCQSPYTCVNGQCVEDPCLKLTTPCETGQVCIEGTCVADPCETVRCPSGFACQLGSCVNTTVLSTRELLATGAGGLACNVTVGAEGAPPRGLLLIFAVALLIMVRPVRRKNRRD